MAATRWSLGWHDRPFEEAALLNPAFCGELIARATHEHVRLRSSAFPLPLAFTVLPLALHSATRRALPRRTDTSFPAWLLRNEGILVELPERVLKLRPATREALLFLTQHKAVKIEGGGLVPGESPLKLSRTLSISTDNVDEIRRAARFLGRWLARQGSPAGILQRMGVAP